MDGRVKKVVANGTDLGYASLIAKRLGVSRSTVSRWLNGESKPSGLCVEQINSKMPELWEKISGEVKPRG
jgi:DNA invertase Pin-like site-specific DNA recombinase